MSSKKPDGGELIKSSIPRTTLNIPMPPGAKPMPPAPSEPKVEAASEQK